MVRSMNNENVLLILLTILLVLANLFDEHCFDCVNINHVVELGFVIAFAGEAGGWFLSVFGGGS